MTANMKLSIVTPLGMVYTGEVKEVYANAVNGEIGILPNHVPFISTTEPGIIRIIEANNQEKFYIASIGFLQVNEDKIEIIVEKAQSPSDLGISEIEAKISEFENILKSKTLYDSDYTKIEKELRYYIKMLELNS